MKTLKAAILTATAVFTTPVLAQSYSEEQAAVADNFTTSEDTVGSIGEYTVPAVEDEAAARWSCEYSHANNDDSVLYPGLVGASPHEHMYGGNSGSDANSTYNSLRTTGTGTCSGNRINRSTYWFPIPKTDETHFKKPDAWALYYKMALNALDGQADDALFTPARLMNGFEMIGGMKPGDLTYYQSPPGVTLGDGQQFIADSAKPMFQCEDGGGTSFDITTIDCASGNRVIVTIEFPSCWDGVHRTSATGRTHVTYKVQDNNVGKAVCPPSHPYLIVTISQKLYFSHNGPSDYENWWWSSDRMGSNPANWSANWSTIHADYREAWSPTFKPIFEHFCNGLTYGGTTGVPHNGGDPHVCDGRLYKNDFISFAETVDAQNIIESPVRLSVDEARPILRMRFRRR